ncbi:MAG: DUF4012 domain-containing protein [Candidatus Nanopelagicales bacterium]
MARRSSTRRRRRWFGLAVVAVVVLAVGWVAASVVRTALAARQLQAELEVAESHAQTLNLAALGADLPAIRQSAGTMQDLSDGVVWRGLSHVPVIGSSASSVRSLSAAVAQASQAGDSLAPVLPELAADRIRRADGSIDTDTLVELADALDAAVPGLASASASAQGVDPNALGPIGEAGVRASTALADLPERTRSAAAAVRIVAQTLGADGPRTTAILLQNGSEARGTGGFVGGYSLVDTDRGALTTRQVDTNNTLDTPIPNGGMPASFYALWGRGETAEWNSYNQTRHFPYIGQLSAAGMKARGTPVDQVIALDAYGVAAILAATGPISADGVTVDATNAVTFFNETVYAQFPDVAEKDRVVADLMHEVSVAVGDGRADLPTLLRELAAVNDEGRISLWSADPATQETLTRWQIGAAVPVARGPWTTVALNNSTANKLDAYVASSVRYQAAQCGAGPSSVTVTLTNNSPEPTDDERFSQGVLDEPPGTTRMMVDVYGPVGARWRSAEIDGKKQFVWQGRERGHPVWQYDLTMARGETSTLTVRFSEPAGDGTPVVWPQSMAIPQKTEAVTDCPSP